jgi:UDP-N-acetylglucosamine--N-acetylmuramyl-(pentapeptide) pyrophosphoryl-undecaprenol N-acetylglucosamine transferase
MKILITGGHLSPALSVIESLKNAEVAYVGRKFALEGDSALSFEYQVITDLGIKFFPLTTARLQRKISRHTFTSFLKLPVGFSQSLKILRSFKPDVVLGFGSYVSLPVVLSAYFLKIPIVIHEQTLEVGFANKILSRFATKICISWQSSEKYFPIQKTVLTGNPLRKEILAINTKTGQNKLPVLFVTGGSLGSHFINTLILESLDKLVDKFEIIHQTGDAKKYQDFEKLTNEKFRIKEKGKRYTLKKFFTPNDSALNLAKADLVISRAGINTVSELLYLSKPALLIPISFSQRDEQLKNAKLLKDNNLAEILESKETTRGSFLNTLFDMEKNLTKYKPNFKDKINSRAAENIIEVLQDVYQKKKIKK